MQFLRGLLRFENIHPIVGSLKRRVFRLNFLEMRVDLVEMHFNSYPANVVAAAENAKGGLDIREYSDGLQDACISLLNSVGSLDYWDSKRFYKDILSTVDSPERDIFPVFQKDSVIALTVLHRPGPRNSLHEVGHVAVRPGFRGGKIASRLLLHILKEARERRIGQIFLETDSFRLAAIKTYLSVGFAPYIKSDNERKRWQKAMKEIAISNADMEIKNGGN